MARTRAKFQCHSVTDHGHNKQVSLGAVYSRKEGTEDYSFTKATPSGTVQMAIDNPESAVQFKPLRLYYVDFIECPEEMQSYDLDGKHKGNNPPMENLNPSK